METQVTKSLSTVPNYNPYSMGNKSLGTATNKSTGGSGVGGDLASQCGAWVNQNRNVYEAIVNGNSGLSQADQSQFLQYWSYATATAQGTNWDPSTATNQQDPTGSQQGNLPAGATVGPNGDIVFNSEEVETPFVPNAQPIHVHSFKFTLDISGKYPVDVEKTQDTTLLPAVDVIKITVHSEPPTTYFVDADSQVIINTPRGKEVTQHGTDALKLDDGSQQITVGTYTASDATSDDNAAASIPGTKKSDGAMEYVANGDDTVDFNPQPVSADGKPRKATCYGDGNIILPGGYSADVTTIMGGDNKPTFIQVTVKDRDGKVTDVYTFPKGFKVDIQGKKDYITFAGKSSDDGVPDSLKGYVTLGVDTTDANNDPTGTATDPETIYQNFLTSSGRSDAPAQLISALNDADYSHDGKPFKTKDDVIAAIKAGEFPPTTIDLKFLKFLKAFDKTLKSKFDTEISALQESPVDKDKVRSARNAINKEMANILGVLYPDQIVDAQALGKDSQTMGIQIGTTVYHWSLNDAGDDIYDVSAKSA